MDTQHPAHGDQPKLADVIAMNTYFAFTPWQSRGGFFKMSRSSSALQLGLQAPDLGTLIQLRALHDVGLANVFFQA